MGHGRFDRLRTFVATTQVPENRHSIVDRQARVRFTTVMLKGEITIRHATLTDAGEIAAIHCASWRDAYANVLDPGFLSGPIEDDRRAIWSERLGRPDPKRLILIGEGSDSVPVGFGCAYRDLDPVWGSWIDNLHVRPGLRGGGIGRHIIRTVARHIEADATTCGLHLWVFEANEAALRFYLRLGGEVVERDSSQISAARGATILRVFWRDIAALSGQQC